ncbi:creatininase family protein [Streptomyces sp. LHD-70]|uniref:creatininase family protein n=1 Tax=Streptomyces sp. LHD-70 TaxID=3072140 RepID=UPI00280E61EF|nr:creatininase family protein [Streptomyces sp. LHD-70]MDQ8705393.1 creatininase family protein [Streptomyces sp. LHD-70]
MAAVPLPTTHRLGELSWTQVRQLAEQDPVVLLPIGAIEQHGPHLPVHEDSIVAEWVADRLAREYGYWVAPALNYGHSGTFRGYPGNLSLSQTTLRNVTYEIIEALVASGFRRIVIVDNNGGNVGPVTGASLDARRDLGLLVGHLYPWQLGYALMRDAYEDPATAYGHGAEPEHSAMLAMFPEQVQSDLARPGGLHSADGWIPTSYLEAAVPGYDVPGTVFWDFSEVSPTGCTGDVSLGSAETGKLWIERVLGFCAAYLAEYDRNTRTAEPAEAK